MSYFLISNFNLGMDRRRPMYSPYEGSIWSGINCHLTRGGDLEKRKAFAAKFNLPAGKTFGLLAASGTLYTFGSEFSVSVPTGITYQRLVHPDGFPMTAVLSATTYDGKTYVVAKFSDGAVYHFYDSVIVPSFVDGIVRPSMTSLSGIATHLASLIRSDSNYTVTTSAEVVTVEHVNLNTPINASATASNRGSINDQSIVAVKTVAAGASTKEKWTFTLSGTFDVGDRFCITLDGKEFGCKSNPIYTPEIVATFRSKIYGLANSLLEFSGTGAANKWNSVMDAGSSYINLSTMDAGSSKLYGIGVYQGNLALFSRRVTQIWYIREDTSQNSMMQVLQNTGTVAPKSVLAYGDIDVFYLDDSGIRSIRARAPSNAAFVNDIGTTIDTFVRDYKATLTADQVAAACSCIEPLDGRFMMAIGNYVFVLSYFPSSQISGWTVYDVGFQITEWATINDRVYCRSGDTIYLYGGDDNATYDSSTVTVQMPFISGNKPSTGKMIKGIDISAVGEWTVDALVDPRNTARMVHFGTINDVSWDDLNVAVLVSCTHIAPRLVNNSSGYASISNIGVSLEGGSER